jgi:hypothetical protein
MWRYGDAGDKWKVKDGDVWVAGGNVLVCGDIEKIPIQRLFEKFGTPDLTYVDPPWNKGNLKSFFTKAGFKGAEVDFHKFIRRLIAIVKRTHGPVYIEMGKQNIYTLAVVIKESGGEVLNIWDVTYYRKHPSKLVRAIWGDFPYNKDIDFSDLDDDDTPYEAIEKEPLKPGAIVFDACTGRGLTCRAAYSNKKKFMGIELHPRRLAVAIDWLAEQGEQPRRAGTIHE